MTFVRHIRMTMLGTIGTAAGPEIWSNSIALAQMGDDGVGPNPALFQFGPNDAVFSDLRDDCVDWFTRPATRIKNNRSFLHSVKFAFIGPNGEYEKPPVEKSAGGVTGGSDAVDNPTHPFQVALATTFHTEGHLGRVKGRIYQVTPDVVPAPATGLIAEAIADGVRDSMDTFLTALGNQPGYDVLDIRACVASQGRRSKSGVMIVPPANHPITAVSVGRTLDTIRRRRNKLADKGVPVAVSQ